VSNFENGKAITPKPINGMIHIDENTVFLDPNIVYEKPKPKKESKMLALLPSIITALVPLAPTLVSVVKDKRKPSLDTEGSQLGAGLALVPIYNQVIGCHETLSLASLNCVDAAAWGVLAVFIAKLIKRAVAKGKTPKAED